MKSPGFNLQYVLYLSELLPCFFFQPRGCVYADPAGNSFSDSPGQWYLGDKNPFIDGGQLDLESSGCHI